MTLGEQIKALRKGAGFTTASKLARKIGCSPDTLRRIERDEQGASEKLLQTIAREIGGYLVIDGSINRLEKKEDGNDSAS